MEEYIGDGYIKLSRKIFNSKTFSNLNAIQKLITIYIMLMANHKDNEWWDKYHKKFVIIKRGSFITSIEQIRIKINDRLVTTKKIRTVLELLKKMDFLAIETASGYSHITILKYNLYQDGENYKGKQKGKARARVGQGKGKGRATNKNGNNDNNEKKKEKIYSAKNRTILYEQIINYLNTEADKNYEPTTPMTIKLINARLKEGHSLDDFKRVIDIKVEEWKGKYSKDGKNWGDYLRPQTNKSNDYNRFDFIKEEENQIE